MTLNELINKFGETCLGYYYRKSSLSDLSRTRADVDAAVKALQDELQETKQKLALSERIHEEKRLGIYYDDK